MQNTAKAKEQKTQEDRRQNEIIRIHKKQNNFVMLDKGFLEDERLSFKAKGILAYLLSKPDNWKVIVKDLINHSNEGKSAIYSGLSELKKAGYYKKEPVRDGKGIIIYWESVIYECPNGEQIPLTGKKNEKKSEKSPVSSPLTDFQDMGNQDMDNQDIDNPYMDNRQRNNNHINHNHKNHNNRSENKSINQTRTDTNDINAIKDAVKNKIDLYHLQAKYPNKQGEIQELYDIINEVLASRKKVFRIAKEDMPAETVKQAFASLDYSHIEYVIECLSKNTSQVKSTKAYLQTALFNAIKTINNHYSLSTQNFMYEKLGIEFN